VRKRIEEVAVVPRLSCRDLGGDCAYVVEGKEADVVKQQMLAHLGRAHEERSSKMTFDEREALDVRIDQVLRRG
jgi:predicted small metal-binding protein